MIEVFIDNKDGNVWDISDIVSDISWKTSRIGSPGSLEFTLIKSSNYPDTSFNISNGDVVSFRKNYIGIFYGYIFSIDGGMEENVKIKCYDQIRYLSNNKKYIFENIKASNIVKRIASDFNLKTGQIDDTGYVIPSMIADGDKLIDTICKSLTFTLINTGKNYFLFDDFGALSVRNSEDLLLEFIVGDESLMHGCKYKKSIDNDTYNRIKLYKDNENTKRREVYIAEDSVNIAKWGMLQMYESVDESLNKAQINELLDTYAALKNREGKTLKIEAIGDIGVRAGCYIPVAIEEYGINQPFLVDECTHRFDGPDHTMSLELKVI